MTTILGSLGGSSVISSASGGKIHAYNAIGTIVDPVNSIVIGANPSRTQITFHNPGSQDIFIAPTTVINNSGAAIALLPSLANLGGCFRVFANGGTLVINGECQTAWFAFAASGSNNPLTVMDSNL